MKREIRATENTIVRDWYHKQYPTDTEWKSLETFTFMDLFNLLDNNYGPDFGDSILRERIFQELAEVMDADYNYVYDQWLNSTKDINMTKYDLGILNFSDFQNGMSIRENFSIVTFLSSFYFSALMIPQFQGEVPTYRGVVLW